MAEPINALMPYYNNEGDNYGYASSAPLPYASEGLGFKKWTSGVDAGVNMALGGGLALGAGWSPALIPATAMIARGLYKGRESNRMHQQSVGTHPDQSQMDRDLQAMLRYGPAAKNPTPSNWDDLPTYPSETKSKPLPGAGASTIPVNMTLEELARYAPRGARHGPYGDIESRMMEAAIRKSPASYPDDAQSFRTTVWNSNPYRWTE